MFGMWMTENPEVMAAEAAGELSALSILDPPECASSPELNEAAGRIRMLENEAAALRLEHQSLQRSIFEAAQIQRRLCAPRQFRSGDFEVAGEIFPVRHLSGDFFKVLDLGSDLGIVVGDIAGKGLSAGIWMPHLVSLLHSCARTHRDPAVAMAEANRELCAGCGEPPLVAAFFARIDLQSGRILYCNAGLPSPLLQHANHVVDRLEQGGPMLGAMTQAVFHSGIAVMRPRDTLIACSDGVTECQNTREEEFELSRLSAAALSTGARNASHLLFSTLGAVLDFAGGCPPRDDLTLLVVRRAAALGASRNGPRSASAESLLQ